MGPRRIVLTAVGLALCVAWPVSAQPAPGPTSSTTISREENLRQMSCRTMPAEFQVACTTAGQPETKSSRSGWTTFLAVVVWVLIPMVLAVAIAGTRDQSIVIAVVLTLILGWIGFVLVYAFLGSRRRDAATLRTGS